MSLLAFSFERGIAAPETTHNMLAPSKGNPKRDTPFELFGFKQRVTRVRLALRYQANTAMRLFTFLPTVAANKRPRRVCLRISTL